MKKNKLYNLVLTACFLGYSWLFFFKFFAHSSSKIDLTACLFKRITTIPCPSCGVTRAIQEIIRGNIISSLLINPFGIIVALIMFGVPFWIIYDYLIKKETFYTFYLKAESIIRTKKVAFFLILLVLLNWIWNIHKQL